MCPPPPLHPKLPGWDSSPPGTPWRRRGATGEDCVQCINSNAWEPLAKAFVRFQKEGLVALAVCAVSVYYYYVSELLCK